MLPKNNRLTYRDSNDLHRHGISFSSPFFTLKASLDNESTKCSVAVSKRVAKKATDRNRIKRRVYAACRNAVHRLPEGTHALLFVRSSVQGAPYEKIESELASLADRVADSKNTA